MMSTSDARVVDLPEPVGPGDEHEASAHLAERADRLGYPERVERRDLVRDRPERSSNRSPLTEDVHPEPSHARYGVGGVELLLVLEALSLARRQDPEDHLPDGLVVEHRASFDRPDRAVQPYAARHLRREVQVRRADADCVTKQVVDVQRYVHHRRRRGLGGREGAGGAPPFDEPLPAAGIC